jgi:hypothetical protein
MLPIPPSVAVIFHDHRQTCVSKIMSEKEQKDGMLTDSHGILMRWKNCFGKQHSCKWSVHGAKHLVPERSYYSCNCSWEIEAFWISAIYCVVRWGMTPCKRNPWITDWVQNLSGLGLFLYSSRWYRVTGLPVLLFVLWSCHNTKLSLCSEYIVLVCCIFSNPTGPCCTHVSSTCPTAKDRIKVLRMGKDHCIKII